MSVALARGKPGNTLDELRLEVDYQLMWTLANIEEFMRVFGVEPHDFPGIPLDDSHRK